MKLMIDIPKDFEQHFNEDKFKDSLLRLKADANYGLEHESTISGNYEIELLDMLVVAFEEAEVIHSTCTLEGIPIKYGEWKWVDDDPNNTDLICTACGEIQDCGHFKFCPNCGVKMKGDKND